MLEKEQPEIALSVKTRQAVRTVLNNLRDGIRELTEDGILQEGEKAKLLKVRRNRVAALARWSATAGYRGLPLALPNLGGVYEDSLVLEGQL